MIKSIVIELITALNHTNFKTRKIAEDSFLKLSEILKHLNSITSLFQILLVGFAGTKSQTQSATIRSLIFLIKQNVSKDGGDGNLKSDD